VAELEPGDEFAGCRIEAVAGRGGMGVVYRATELSLGRPVALKLLTPDRARDRDFRERFQRESRMAAAIDHPNVIPVYAAGEYDGFLYLVMRYVGGTDLHKLLRAEGSLDPSRAAQLVAQVAAALDAAHAAGLVHRDVKPANVLLAEDGRIILTDFGIAALDGDPALTRTGALVGSPGFIAPERLDGEPGGPASDLWSLGATLYVALTGAPAYEGSAAQRVRATLTQPVPVAPGPLGPLLAAMMAQHPAARPDAPVAVQALRQVAAGGPAPRLPTGHDVTAPGQVRRGGRAVLWIAAAAVLIVAAGTAGFLILRNQDNGVPAAFTVPMDVCTLISGQDVGRLLRTQSPPKGQPSSDDVGPKCGWPISGSGVGLQVQKDSDTVDPWSMTEVSARTLFQSQKRWWTKYDTVDWTWPEIGAKGSRQAKRTPVRQVGGVGDEAFGFELTGSTGRIHSAYVYYRLANLVVSVEYSTLADKPTDEDVKQAALKAAQASVQALRDAG
jgi:serine/threonine protein kinase